MRLGDTINPALSRSNWNPMMQGAAQGSAAMGQGMASFGQSIAGGMDQYRLNKEEDKKLEKLGEILFDSPEEKDQFRSLGRAEKQGVIDGIVLERALGIQQTQQAQMEAQIRAMAEEQSRQARRDPMEERLLDLQGDRTEAELNQLLNPQPAPGYGTLEEAEAALGDRQGQITQNREGRWTVQTQVNKPEDPRRKPPEEVLWDALSEANKSGDSEKAAALQDVWDKKLQGQQLSHVEVMMMSMLRDGEGNPVFNAEQLRQLATGDRRALEQTQEPDPPAQPQRNRMTADEFLQF